MFALLLGLILFLGLHSLRIVAESWRNDMVVQLGPKRWRGLYSLGAALGLGLIIWGYGQARLTPQVLWASPPGLRHLAAALTLPAFVLLVAAYVPGNVFKRRLGHPMLMGTLCWALAHLLANNTLADLLLFGGFLVWAGLCLRAARARDALHAPVRVPPRPVATVITVVAGLAAWAGFAFWAHAAWIGVAPFGAR